MNVTVVGGQGKIGGVMAEHIRYYYPVRVADMDAEPTAEATENADIVIVIVNTGSLPSGAYDISNVLDVCGEVDLSRYRLVMICSTVNPGDVDDSIREMLERDGKVAHRDFGLVYVPELVRQGSVMEDFAYPTQIIAGVQTQLEESAVYEFCTKVQHTEPTFMSIASAEIAKLAVNTFLTAKMAKANEIAWLCQMTTGADARDVLGIVGADPRIADAYIRPGPPPGGPCFPRDDRALAAAWEKANLGSSLSEGVARVLEWQVIEMARLVTRHATKGDVIGVCGLAFKPRVVDSTESPGLRLARLLHAETYDPDLPSKHETLSELVEACDIIILTMPFSGMAELRQMDLSSKTVWDWWGAFDDEFLRFGKGIETC